MTQANDFLLDEDGDLIITNGDFKVGFSDPIHIQHILAGFTGWYRNYILVGLGIGSYLKSSGTELEIKRGVQIQLQADNYKINYLSIKANPEFTCQVDAIRIK